MMSVLAIIANLWWFVFINTDHYRYERRTGGKFEVTQY